MYCALAMLDIAQFWGYRGLRQPSRSELPVVVSLNLFDTGQTKAGCIIKLCFVFIEPCVCFFELGLQLMQVLHFCIGFEAQVTISAFAAVASRVV